MRTTVEQATDNIVFHTAIHQHHIFSVADAVFYHLFATCLPYQILFVRVIKINVGAAIYNDLPQHRTFIPQNFSQRSCVDTANANHIFFNQPITQTGNRLPVTILSGVILADNGLRVNFLTFEICTHAIKLFFTRRYAIITNKGECGNKNLT